MSPELSKPRLAAAVHGALIALLIALRPLVWDEDASAVPALAYLVLIGVALAVALGESLAGARRQWRWGASGMLFGALALALVMPAMRSPLPAQGAGLWLMVASQVGLAAYLTQAVPGRERVALAGLGAGLLGESLIAVLQWPWVLPAMARAQQEGRLAGVVSGDLQGDLSERIANGGVYGTFTLANGLAGYLLLAAPPLIASALTRGASPVARAVAVVIAVVAALAFLGTSSKGAYLALAVAVVIWWWLTRRGALRWLAPAGLALAVAAALTVPHLRAGLRASADVRIGYWEAAVELVREHPLRGWGLRGYAEESPRALPTWAEFSTHAHNDPLELAAEGGLPLGLMLVCLLVLLPRARGGAPDDTPVEEPSRAVPWVLGFGILYFGMLGLFDANIGWWPGGGDAVGTILWTTLVAVVMALVFAALLRLPPPPGWACLLALGALALHSLIDFDLHSGAIVGTAVACAVLAPGLRSRVGSADRHLPTPALVTATIVVAGYAALVVAACVEGLRLRSARAIADAIEAMQSGSASSREDLQDQFAAIAARSGQPEPSADTADRPQARTQVVVTAFVRADQLAGPDYELRTRLLSLVPPGSHRAEFTARLASQRPASAAVQGLWSQDERASALAAERAGDADAAATHWHQALDHLRRSVELSPLIVGARMYLLALLEEAAQHLPAEADTLHAEAERERATIKDLNGRVNPRYRVP